MDIFLSYAICENEVKRRSLLVFMSSNYTTARVLDKMLVYMEKNVFFLHRNVNICMHFVPINIILLQNIV